MTLGSTSLRSRLMLLVVTAIVPIFGLMLYQAECEQERKLRECGEEARRLATLAAGGISQTTEGARQMLMALACTEPARTMDPGTAGPLFAALMEHSGVYRNLGLVRADGVIIASGLPMKGEISIADRLWFKKIRETGDLTVSEYIVGRITGLPAINLGFPLHSGPREEFRGAVFAALDLKVIQKCIARVRLPEHAVILVVDRKGTCVARHPMPEKVGSTVRSWAEFQKNGAQIGMPVSAVGGDGTLRNYYYVAVPGTEDLFVAVGISQAAATEESRGEFWRNVAILVLWTGVSLGVAWVMGQVSVLKHVRNLSETARRLAVRDWHATADVSGGVAEIQQLARTFNAMAAALRRQNEELEAQVRQRTAELSASNASLTEALAQVTTLNGLLPICSGCKKIRDDQGYWSQIEHYIAAHSGAQFSHSLCPDCAKKYYPELDLDEALQEPPAEKPQ